MFENCKYLLSIKKDIIQNEIDENIKDSEISYKNPAFIFETIENTENSQTLTLYDYISEIKPNEELYTDINEDNEEKSKINYYISSMHIIEFNNILIIN